MEITWYGLSCFKLSERGAATVVTDPYDSDTTGFSPLKLKADIITTSHFSPGHSHKEAIQGNPHIISGPGEYEIGGVFITGIQTRGQKRTSEIRNTLYVFDFDSLTIAHLGDVSHIPAQAEIEALGPVHIALIPVGGGNSLNAAQAAEVVNLLEPKIVIPMHYATPGCKIPLDGLSKFLKEMGISEIQERSSFTITYSTLPEESQIVLLDTMHQ